MTAVLSETESGHVRSAPDRFCEGCVYVLSQADKSIAAELWQTAGYVLPISENKAAAVNDKRHCTDRGD